MKKLLALILSILLLVSLFPGNVFATMESNFESAVDFSPVSPGVEAWDGNGIPAYPNVFSEAGIWVDDPANYGFGAEKLDHNGIVARDTNGDGVSDAVYFYDVLNHGCRFTIGFNRQNNFEGAKAIAIRFYNGSGRGWSDNEKAQPIFTLYDTDGKAYNSLTATKAPISATSAYINLDDNTIRSTNIFNSGYCGYNGKNDGWYIIDLSAFEAGFDVTKLAKLYINTDSRTSAYPGIKDIGFIKDVSKFVKDTIGVDYTAPNLGGYESAVDFSGVNPGVYSWADGGVVEYPNAHSEAGIWVDDPANYGLGADKLDHNGIESKDTNGDGVSDSIFLYDVGAVNNGCRITIGFNKQNNFEGAKAIAVRIFNHSGQGFEDKEIAQVTLTLYDTDGNAYSMRYKDIADGTDSVYVNIDSKTVNSTYVPYNGYCGYEGKNDGWYIIDLSAFGEGLDVTKLAKLHFNFPTKTNPGYAYPGIKDIGFVKDVSKFVKDTIGVDYDKPTPVAVEPVVFAKGSSVIKLEAAKFHKYSLDGETWVDSTEFTGLTKGETYTVYSCILENEYMNKSNITSIQVTLYDEGDIDHDGKVDGIDLVSVRRSLIGLFEVEDAYAADANLDGTIDIRDLINIKKKAI